MSAGPGGALLLSLQHCGLRQGGAQLLAPLSLQLHRGERLALLGSNGAGKTSLLRLLHGLVPGRQLHCPGLREAMVFQQPFFLRLSLRRNLLLALWLAGVAAPERAARADEALARVGLTALAGRDACALSGGERQRLALARAWALRAELLLLDEPCAHLDPGGRRRIEALLGEFAAAGMTLVFSTHQIAQARRLASRVLYLEQGRLQVDLPAAAFFGPARPPAAAAFLEDE